MQVEGSTKSPKKTIMDESLPSSCQEKTIVPTKSPKKIKPVEPDPVINSKANDEFDKLFASSKKKTALEVARKSCLTKQKSIDETRQQQLNLLLPPPLAQLENKLERPKDLKPLKPDLRPLRPERTCKEAKGKL